MEVNAMKSNIEVNLEKVKLGSLIDVLSGFAFDSKKFNDCNGTPLIRIRDIKRSYTETYYLGDFDSKYLVGSGDILIGMDGEFNVAEWKGVEALLNQRVCKVLVKKKELIDLKYLFYFLPFQLKLIEEKASFVTVKHLSVSDIKDIEIPLPPLSTQKRIAEILDAADALRRKDQELLKKYDELAQAIFIDMFGDPVKNEKGWEKMKMEKLMTILRGGSPRPIEKFIGGTNPWIKIGDGTKGDDVYLTSTKEYITDEGLSKTRKLPAGSLIFANCGVSLGFARIITFEGCIHDGWLAFSDFDTTRVNKIFLLKALNSITEYFRNSAPEGTQPNLNTGIMKDFELILPPIELQEKFENILAAFKSAKKSAELNNYNSRALFDSLIQKAFNGELV